MARGRSGTSKGLGGLRASGTEALQLVIDYVKQETLTPLRGLGRYILFGVAGSVALAVGLVILAVSFLRVPARGDRRRRSTETCPGCRT